MGVFSFSDLLYTSDALELRFYYLILLFHTLSLRLAAPLRPRSEPLISQCFIMKLRDTPLSLWQCVSSLRYSPTITNCIP
jgi:hypothetical protein